MNIVQVEYVIDANGVDISSPTVQYNVVIRNVTFSDDGKTLKISLEVIDE